MLDMPPDTDSIQTSYSNITFGRGKGLPRRIRLYLPNWPEMLGIACLKSQGRGEMRSRSAWTGGVL
jgi:hypothetical protein